MSGDNPQNFSGYNPFLPQSNTGIFYAMNQNYPQHQALYQIPPGPQFSQGHPAPLYQHMGASSGIYHHSAVQAPQVSVSAMSNQNYAVGGQQTVRVPTANAQAQDERTRGKQKVKIVKDEDEDEWYPSRPKSEEHQGQSAIMTRDRSKRTRMSSAPLDTPSSNQEGVPDTSTRTTRSRRRSSKGKLRRNTTVDGIMVEEPFTLSLPSENANAMELIRQSNDNHGEEDGEVGDGCYISCTVHRRRYYGVLIDQNALKAASTLHFKNEADSLDLNRRMLHLFNHRGKNPEVAMSDGQSERDSSEVERVDNRDKLGKRLKSRDSVENQTSARAAENAQFIDSATDTSVTPKTTPSDLTLPPQDGNKQVQKFHFTPPEIRGPGYRTLLATYANVHAAAEDAAEKARLIFEACEGGGNFVGSHYYQYLSSEGTLVGAQSFESGHIHDEKSIMLHTSLSLSSFLQSTSLPPWYPLSNLDGFSQSKVLSILKLKKKENGEIEFDDSESVNQRPRRFVVNHNLTETAPRTAYRIGVLGGGIAGLACAAELLRLAESDEERIDIEVVLLEGRDRIGGRIHTDCETFNDSEGNFFPVDLGAAWIHGINGNPLTDLATEAGATLIPTSEDVKMLSSNMKEADEDVDKRMFELFDDLLDQGAAQCWQKYEVREVNESTRHQKAVRWYGSVFSTDVKHAENNKPVASDVPIHRHSTDITVNHAIGIAATGHKDARTLTAEEQRFLLWHTKNTEYAVGANIDSLSMKFLTFDEDHAFDGDHVLLREGYRKITDLLLKRCSRRENFKLILGFPVGRVDYANWSTSFPVPGKGREKSKRVDITNTCSVTSQDRTSRYEFDFLVCALPLGVLKNSADVSSLSEGSTVSDKVIFNPPLPFSKRDAIEAVGFGVLNKIFLQFPFAFWRKRGLKEYLRGTPFLGENEHSFGNVSGKNPHHYMFYDVGRIMNDPKDDNPLAILFTMISGCEAIRMEQLSDEAITLEAMQTLKNIYAAIDVPDPLVVKITRWASDEFARGSYSFLPPGATNEDYTLLQIPVNGSGDKYSVGNMETMRLFWAGEHTTSLHPSVTHGALLSGIRAAQEVINEMHVKHPEDLLDWDLPIPVTMFRAKHPTESLRCQLCNKVGRRDEEGDLVAFQNGLRQALVHLHCAEYSPEVETDNENWKNVLKAVSRGKLIKCSRCKEPGASIGCNEGKCSLSYHFSCCEDEGWSFELDGKQFLCRMHRRGARPANCLPKEPASTVSAMAMGPSETDCGITLELYRKMNPSASMVCRLCGGEEDEANGKLLAYCRNDNSAVVHCNCALYSTNVEIIHGSLEGGSVLFKNMVDTTFVCKNIRCKGCMKPGASIECFEQGCNASYHFPCARRESWDFERDGKNFSCRRHRQRPSFEGPSPPCNLSSSHAIQHELLSTLASKKP